MGTVMGDISPTIWLATKEGIDLLEVGAATVPDVIFYISEVFGFFILKGWRAT